MPRWANNECDLFVVRALRACICSPIRFQVHNLSGPIRFEDKDGPAMPSEHEARLRLPWPCTRCCLPAKLSVLSPCTHDSTGDLLVVEICNLGPLPGALNARSGSGGSRDVCCGVCCGVCHRHRLTGRLALGYILPGHEWGYTGIFDRDNGGGFLTVRICSCCAQARDGARS